MLIKDIDSDFRLISNVIGFILHLIVFLGFFIYVCVIYNKVYMNENLDKLLEIKSDYFINDFIKEYVSKFKDNQLIKWTISILIISFVSELIGFIIFLANKNN
jgi:hypothetical protein